MCCGLAAPAAAIESGAASGFIESLGNEAIRTLTEDGIEPKLREERFKQLLDRGFAINGIARFVLGRHWRSASKEQKKRYLGAFERLIVKSYAARFEQYSGESFHVTGERADGKKGRIVGTEVNRLGGPVIVVQWRVRETRDALKIVDVIIEGVSMSITQRSDFNAVIQRKGGSIDGLIEELEKKVAALD